MQMPSGWSSRLALQSTSIEGDSATDVIGSGEDAQFYRVVVTIEDK